MAAASRQDRDAHRLLTPSTSGRTRTRRSASLRRVRSSCCSGSLRVTNSCSQRSSSGGAVQAATSTTSLSSSATDSSLVRRRTVPAISSAASCGTCPARNALPHGGLPVAEQPVGPDPAGDAAAGVDEGERDFGGREFPGAHPPPAVHVSLSDECGFVQGGAGVGEVEHGGGERGLRAGQLPPLLDHEIDELRGPFVRRLVIRHCLHANDATTGVRQSPEFARECGQPASCGQIKAPSRPVVGGQ